jgi:cytochrome d ubiquinol oxidase subunit I
MAMPLLMVVAEWLGRRRNDPVYLDLAKRWAKGTAILFAVGAVSGTVLSFELGLLWPGFMEHAGPIIGMPFSLEGAAFFLEAIALGIYLYGWERVPPRVHLAAGVVVLISGVASGVFVVCANGWMNTPQGFDWVDGRAENVDVWAAMFNPAAATEAVHMTLAAFAAIGFAVAGIHAYRLRKASAGGRLEKESALDRRALGIALVVGGVAALLMPVSGDFSAKMVAEHQPVKFAAMEAQWETERGAPARIGGWPIESEERTVGAIEIPKLGSFLAFGDPDATVRGLLEVAPDPADRPPVAVVHAAFQIMVGCGSWLVAVTLIAAFLAWRKRSLPVAPWFLRMVVVTAPLGFVAIEAGWTVTEVGRQPWIIHGVMRTADAVTPMEGLQAPFVTFTLLYLLLSVIVVVLLRRIVLAEHPT